MKQKKIYKSPIVKSMDLNIYGIVCMNIHSEEAPFVGARMRKRQEFDDIEIANMEIDDIGYKW